MWGRSTLSNKTNSLNWSSVIPMSAANKHTIPEVPGVYRVYIVDANMIPLPILRKNGNWDKEGIMYIGGTPRTGTLRGGFYMTFKAHRGGMNGKIEPNGKEQDLVELWRCIHAVYPGAGVAFQYSELASNLDAESAKRQLHQEYAAIYGENPQSGKDSLLHDPDHPWRKYLYGKK